MAKLRLDSWKSIAKYLDRGQRTVQRWHAEHGLPVHHFGGTQGCVFAYADDLDGWLSAVAGKIEPQQGVERVRNETKEESSSYLASRADEMWTTRSEKNLGTIAQLYREALDKDPGSVHALTGLANAMICSAILEVVDSSVAYACAVEAIRRVPLLNFQDFDAKYCAAFLKMAHDRKWRQSRAAFEDLLREQPSNFLGLLGRALLHVADAEFREASRRAWEAWSLNPLVSSTRFLLCWIPFLAGDYAEALELAAQFKATGSSGAMLAAVSALALSRSAPPALAIEQIESLAAEFPQSRTLQGIVGYARGISGQSKKASQMLATLLEMSERKKNSCGYALALTLIGLGRKQEAIPWLEASFEQGSIWSLGFRSDPILKPLRGDQRFESLLRKIGCHTETLAIDQARFMSQTSHPVPTGFQVGGWGRCVGVYQSLTDDLEEHGAA